MSTVVNPTTQSRNGEFVPPPYAEPHIRRQLDDLLKDVESAVAPVWPLKDYVAVNPYAGFSGRPFDETARFVRLFSDCELLMPFAFFHEQWQHGSFGLNHLTDAIAELGFEKEITARQLIDELPALALTESEKADAPRPRLIRTIAELVKSTQGTDWPSLLQEEITKHCAAHYDEGESSWNHASRSLPLYQAWRERSSVDRSLELLGVSGFRRFVKELPHTPDAAIVHLLERLGVPEPWWQTFLLCQAFAVPGWSAWTKYQSEWNSKSESDHRDFIGLLAIRLAYDVALSEQYAINLGWNSLSIHQADTFAKTQWPQIDSNKRLALLRAMEIGYRDQVRGNLDRSPKATESPGTGRKLAQLTFCIDVRSERMRRNLETVNDEIETFGFAGFFAMPIEHVGLGEPCGNSHLPVLLEPTYRMTETLAANSGLDEQQTCAKRHQIRRWRKLWKTLKTSPISCFPFVETVGLTYAARLMSRVFGWGRDAADACGDAIAGQSSMSSPLVPKLDTINGAPVRLDQQVDLAEGLLRGLGLTDGFARLVVFCGHSAETENNPLAASLDCGACGGHSGQPNAQLAAYLLNQDEVRRELDGRGIRIPEDTWFLAGFHNTTTDEVSLLDLDGLPESVLGDTHELLASLRAATQRTRNERMPELAATSADDLQRRANDWSEVRPEWGLAGNAAMIIAPRSMTKDANLGGRTFLHSYDQSRDVTGAILESIMNGPLVVAHWINMQYYASSVDPKSFGSGSKTVHNVVGQFGLLSGSAGDLMTGLPWQSVHSGSDFQHQPMRLQVVIAATRASIQHIVEKHELLQNLLNHRWIYLSAIEDGDIYDYEGDGRWKRAMDFDSPSRFSKSMAS